MNKKRKSQASHKFQQKENVNTRLFHVGKVKKNHQHCNGSSQLRKRAFLLLAGKEIQQQ